MTGPHVDSRARSSVYVVFLLVLAVMVGIGVFGILVQTAAETPGEFTVTALDPGNVSVDENDTVAVAARIENTGGVADTQVVSLQFGTRERTVSIRLDPGESETIELEGIDAGEFGLGNVSYRMTTDDDESAATVAVESERPAAFEIKELEPGDLTAAREERIDVSALVENTGGTVGNQTVVLRVDGEPVAETAMSLGPNEAETFDVYNLGLAVLDPGNRTYSVATANETATATITVPVPATLEIAGFDPGEVVVDESERFDASITVENVGERWTNRTVALRADGDTVRERRLELLPGGVKTVTFEGVEGSTFGVGVHSYDISTGDGARSGTIIVEGEDPPSYDVSALEPGTVTVPEEGSFNVSATVENTGAQIGETDIELRVAGDVRAATSLELPPGESEVYRVYNVYVGALEAGEYEYEVIADTDSESGTLVVEE